MVFHHLLVYIGIGIASTLSILFKKLTPGAGLAGCFIALALYQTTGLPTLSMLSAFFIAGVSASRFKSSFKKQNGFAPSNHEQRKASQVWANAGVATGLSIADIFLPFLSPLTPILIAAAFSSAAADTISSETGNVLGKKYYNILTLKTALRGTNGAISIEGTLMGLMASIFIAAIYTCWFGWSPAFGIIIVAGTIGNLADSVLGATLENRNYIGNDTVNFLNTLIAVFSAAILCLL